MGTEHNNSFYNAGLRKRARFLRKKMTKAEACLWKYGLKAGAMMGYGFRRERPILRYIADFMCPELRLIIEVDGATHFFEEVQRKDKKKQAELEAAGFRVLRFTDTDVLTNIKGVISVVESAVEEQEKKLDVKQPSTP